jgi:hypothetical protein
MIPSEDSYALVLFFEFLAIAMVVAIPLSILVIGGLIKNGREK